MMAGQALQCITGEEVESLVTYQRPPLSTWWTVCRTVSPSPPRALHVTRPAGCRLVRGGGFSFPTSLLPP